MLHSELHEKRCENYSVCHPAAAVVGSGTHFGQCLGIGMFVGAFNSSRTNLLRQQALHAKCESLELLYEVELVPPHPVTSRQQAASSVLYTTICKYSLVLVRMGEIIA